LKILTLLGIEEFVATPAAALDRPSRAAGGFSHLGAMLVTTATLEPIAEPAAAAEPHAFNSLAARNLRLMLNINDEDPIPAEYHRAHGHLKRYADRLGRNTNERDFLLLVCILADVRREMVAARRPK
jgi:hypothetical protein